MKNLTVVLLLFSSIFCLAQNEESETVYLLFDTTSKEKCIVEDGSGKSQSFNAYRKEYQEYNNLTPSNLLLVDLVLTLTQTFYTSNCN